MSFFAELKRRNVFKVGVVYAIVAWLLVQVIVAIETPLHLPGWFDTAIIVLLLIGFPVTLLFAWAFETTPQGIKRTGQTESGEDDTAETIVSDTEFEAPEKSVAVLPFVNMSSDPEQEYFSDGISEELLNLLTRVPTLKVIARTSSFSYKGKDVPITQIASDLNVAHILEGSVRKSGDRVRITAQLIRASDSSHLWSETYDRTFEDIFAIQDQVAAAVVKELKIRLLGEIPTANPVNPEAYNLFLQGRIVDRQLNLESLQRAASLFQQALEIEPDYAPAWSALGYVHVQLWFMFHLEDHAEPARQAARRALALDPDNAAAYATLGGIARNQGNLVDAARYFEQALALDPKDSAILGSTAAMLFALDRSDVAIALLEFSVTIDPTNPHLYMYLALFYSHRRQLGASIRAARTALDLNPGLPYVHANIGNSLMAKGQLEEALAEINQETLAEIRLRSLAVVYHALGKATDSDTALLELTEKHDSQPTVIAWVYADRGEADQAFDWLERAAQMKDSNLQSNIHAVYFDNIHNDSRWLPFLESIGMSPAQLAAIEFNYTLPE